MAAVILYLETSVWGSLAADQPKSRRRLVRRLLSLIDGKRARAAISDTVLGEIADAPPEEVEIMEAAIASVEAIRYPVTEEARKLAAAYLAGGVLPARRDADALHVAVATCFECNYLVSWNHRHMTRPTKRLQYEAVNQLNGYMSTPLICNPAEACDELRR